MRSVFVVVALVLAPLASALGAQPPPGGQPPAAPTLTDPGQLLARAVVTGESMASAAAVESLLKAGAEGRARLRGLVERAMAAGETLPPVDPAVPQDPKAATQPLDDATAALVAGLVSDDAEKADAAVVALKEAAGSASDQVRRLVGRCQAVLGSYVLRVFRDHAQSNAIFAGQYTPLRELGPAGLRLVSGWMVTPPMRSATAALRAQCIRALRDMVEGQPDEALAASLRGVAGKATEDREVRREAMYALAQFGDRTFVDPEQKRLEAQLEGENVAAKGAALAGLADMHYQLRDYARAVEAYEQHIALIEAGTLPRSSVASMPTLYYNACCSMALGGMTDKAFTFLEKAIAEGRKGQPLGRRLLEVDMDIDTLRKDPRFAKVMESLGGR